MLKSFTAGSAGTGAAAFAAPESISGTHKVLIRGTSGLRKSVNVTVKPGISLSPKSGPVATKITVTLKGFKAGEIVDFRWYVTSTSFKTLKNNAVASSLGTIKTIITAPTPATSGIHKVDAVGEGGSHFNATFSVTTVQQASVNEPASTPLPRPTPTSEPTVALPTPEPQASPVGEVTG